MASAAARFPVTLTASRTGELGRLLALPVRINGEGPFKLYLDTGAPRTVVSQNFARAHGIEARESAQSLGAGGAIAAHRATLHALELGSLRHENLQSGIVGNFDALHRVSPDVVGSLGLDVLQHYTVRIDYRTDTVEFSDERLPANSGVPFELQRGIYVTARLDAQGPFDFYFDTGAEVTVVSPDVVKRLNLAQFATTVLSGAGGTGSIGSSAAALRSVRLGEYERIDTFATVFDTAPLSAMTQRHFDGIIGYPVFGGGALTIDFIDRRLAF